MPAIKAIETEYRGHLMRSRLEARWAVFFDALRVNWIYESQGFELPSGARYLPDFQLPDHDLWVEVKGDENELRADGARLAEFVTTAPTAGLLILGSIPETRRGLPQHFVLTRHRHCCDKWVLCLHIAWAEMLARPQAVREFGFPCTDQLSHAENELPELKGYGRGEYTDPGVVGFPEWDPGTAAYRAARSARFEHGDGGAML